MLEKSRVRVPFSDTVTTKSEESNKAEISSTYKNNALGADDRPIDIR